MQIYAPLRTHSDLIPPGQLIISAHDTNADKVYCLKQKLEKNPTHAAIMRKNAGVPSERCWQKIAVTSVHSSVHSCSSCAIIYYSTNLNSLNFTRWISTSSYRSAYLQARLRVEAGHVEQQFQMQNYEQKRNLTF